MFVGTLLVSTLMLSACTNDTNPAPTTTSGNVTTSPTTPSASPTVTETPTAPEDQGPWNFNPINQIDSVEKIDKIKKGLFDPQDPKEITFTQNVTDIAPEISDTLVPTALEVLRLTSGGIRELNDKNRDAETSAFYIEPLRPLVTEEVFESMKAFVTGKEDNKYSSLFTIPESGTGFIAELEGEKWYIDNSDESSSPTTSHPIDRPLIEKFTAEDGDGARYIQNRRVIVKAVNEAGEVAYLTFAYKILLVLEPGPENWELKDFGRKRIGDIDVVRVK